MLFINLEYQLLLTIVLIFSSYLLINALTIRHQPEGIRAFGLTFALPLILAIASFLSATYHLSGAAALLVLGHLFMVLLCTVVLLSPQNSRGIKVFYVLPFIFIAVSLFISSSPLYEAWYNVFCFIALGLVLVNLALVIHSILQGEKERLMVYLGLFMMATSVGLWLLSKMLTIEALLILTVGYVICNYYSHHLSLGLFFKDYHEKKEALNRMNGSIHSEVIRRVEEIERSNRKLLEISKTDSMTGLYIKSAVVKSLESILERTPQGGFSILMFDIDHFKLVNDNLGHQIGDKCIKTIASLAKTSFRNDDILGRYGGDEFIVILPGTPPVKSYIIADRFRQLVQSKSSPQITVSVGIASCPEDGNTVELLIEAADKALYFSKQKGRNQVTLFSSQKSKE